MKSRKEKFSFLRSPLRPRILNPTAPPFKDFLLTFLPSAPKQAQCCSFLNFPSHFLVHIILPLWCDDQTTQTMCHGMLTGISHSRSIQEKEEKGKKGEDFRIWEGLEFSILLSLSLSLSMYVCIY